MVSKKTFMSDYEKKQFLENFHMNQTFILFLKMKKKKNLKLNYLKLQRYLVLLDEINFQNRNSFVKVIGGYKILVLFFHCIILKK